MPNDYSPYGSDYYLDESGRKDAARFALEQLYEATGIPAFKRYKQAIKEEYTPGRKSALHLAEAMAGVTGLGSISPQSLNMIKGKDPQVVKILRGLMAEENRARGAMPGSDIESKVLRGTWYRGQRTIPEPIATPEGNLMTSFRREGVETVVPGPPVFSMARTSALKVGEPSGVSISAKPSVASGFAKWGEGEQELLQGARDEALDSVQSILEKHNAKSKYYNIADQINNPGYKSWIVTEDLDKIKASNPDDYNKLIEDIKGWSEINDRLNAGPPIARVMPMYGGVPEEKILRISNPEHQEVIKSSYEEALKKFVNENPNFVFGESGGEGYMPTKEGFIDELRYSDSMRKKFNDILSGTMQEKGYKGLLYTPQRYGEYELKMFDPKDIMALDVRRIDDPTLSKLFKSDYDEPIGKGAKKLGEWTEASYGKPAHLKELYRDIDVDSILKNLYEARYEGKSMRELEKRPFKLDPSNKPDVEIIGPNDWQPGSYSEHVKELGKYNEGEPSMYHWQDVANLVFPDESIDKKQFDQMVKYIKEYYNPDPVEILYGYPDHMWEDIKGNLKSYVFDSPTKPIEKVAAPDLDFDLEDFKPNKVQKLYLDKIDPDGSYSPKEQEAAINYLLDQGYGDYPVGDIQGWVFKEAKANVDEMFGKSMDEIFTPNWSQLTNWIDDGAGVKEAKEIVAMAKKLGWTEDTVLSMDNAQLDNFREIYSNKVMKKMLLGE